MTPVRNRRKRGAFMAGSHSGGTTGAPCRRSGTSWSVGAPELDRLGPVLLCARPLRRTVTDALLSAAGRDRSQRVRLEREPAAGEVVVAGVVVPLCDVHRSTREAPLRAAVERLVRVVQPPGR